MPKNITPTSVILRGRLKMPVPSAAAIIPNVAAFNDAFGVEVGCLYEELETNEDSSSSFD